MSLTSLGIASNGLLDGGGSPSLHLASMGLLRDGSVVNPPVPPHAGTGGGIGKIGKGTLERWRREQILRDDEEVIMLCIKEFLRMENDG